MATPGDINVRSRLTAEIIVPSSVETADVEAWARNYAARKLGVRFADLKPFSTVPGAHGGEVVKLYHSPPEVSGPVDEGDSKTEERIYAVDELNVGDEVLFEDYLDRKEPVTVEEIRAEESTVIFRGPLGGEIPIEWIPNGRRVRSDTRNNVSNIRRVSRAANDE